MTADHRAEAERLLADADEWAAQAGELSPEASELSCLAYAAVHALLAIHDTLTAADRYAANEARQREAAGPDPLDEDDHRDRVDAGGTRWTRAADECWSNGAHHVLELISLPGPLTFAPEPPPDAARDDLSASEGESGHVEGEAADDAPEALLCPECGHDIDRHAYDDDRAVDLCGECPDTERCPTPLPSQVARALIEQAVEQAGGRRG